MTEIPKTQKVWHATKRGEPAKVLKLTEDVPVPSKLAKGEVLVKVQAAALNPVYDASRPWKCERHLT